MSGAEPVRAVVDTNILVSGLILRRGVPHALPRALYAGAFQVIVSPALQSEYLDVLPRPKFKRKYGLTPAEIDAFLTLVSTQPEFADPPARAPIPVRDPDDALVLALALETRVDYLVTGDNDLLVLAADPRLGALKIVTAREFLAVLGRIDEI